MQKIMERGAKFIKNHGKKYKFCQKFVIKSMDGIMVKKFELRGKNCYYHEIIAEKKKCEFSQLNALS